MTSQKPILASQAPRKHGLFHEGIQDQRFRWLFQTWVPLSILFVPLVMIWGGLSPLNFALTILAGLFVWTFVEYILHRWVMHRSGWTQKIDKAVESFLPHRTHHKKPDDDEIAIIEKPLKPLFLAILAAIGLCPYMPWTYAFTFVFGAALGYVAYELVHFSTHKCRMDGPIGRRLLRQHMLHHFRDDTKNYGVTSPLWDIVFGTVYRPARKPVVESNQTG